MNLLLIGGTGRIGKLLVKNLSDRGVNQIRVLGKSAERISTLPENIDSFVGDIVEDPWSVKPAFQNIDTVFMTNSASIQEAVEGMLCVSLAREAGVKHFVYQSVHHLDRLAYLPHVGSKLLIRRTIEQSDMDYTLLCPNVFFQNDELGRNALLNSNLYIQPLGNVGCSSVDIGDIADAAAIVLTTEGHSGKSYNLVGPDNLTSSDCAAIWSQTLGRDIDYIKDIVTWQEAVKPFMPAWKVYDLGMMYDDFSRNGMLGNKDDIERMRKLLGREPKSYKAFVENCVSEWLKQPSND